MKTRSTKEPKNSHDRPPKDVAAFQASPELQNKIETWASQQADKPKLSQAIRRLVELGLTTSQPSQKGSARSTAKAAGLAGDMVDFLGDQSATAEDRAKRKRRLLKGPSEFRQMRDDHAKMKPNG